MSDANLLMLAIGPAAVIVRADRESKGISETQLARKWEAERATAGARGNSRRQLTLGLSLDGCPRVRIEWR